MSPESWRPEAERSLRRWAIASLAGGLIGLVVGGVGGRLFMALLAGLNREDHGVITSDGFEMGRTTLSGTLGLLLVGAMLGVLGGGTFLAVRGLRIGPRWFGAACIAVGGTVAVGAGLVHSDGPDFTLLQPTWAAIALTLSVPLTYLVVMPVVADRWLQDDSALMTSTSRWLYLALIPWIFPLFLFTPVLVGGWWAARVVARTDAGWAARARSAAPWIGRLVLLAIFTVALVVLVGTVLEIYAAVDEPFAS